MTNRIAKLVAKRDNAARLAEIARETAARYESVLPLMSQHHRIKAQRWQEAADDLTEQINYENSQSAKL